jgi:hypothetical protein
MSTYEKKLNGFGIRLRQCGQTDRDSLIAWNWAQLDLPALDRNADAQSTSNLHAQLSRTHSEAFYSQPSIRENKHGNVSITSTYTPEEYAFYDLAGYLAGVSEPQVRKRSRRASFDVSTISRYTDAKDKLLPVKKTSWRRQPCSA